MSKILIEVDEALHKELKIKAIEEGVSMYKAVILGIEWYVSEDRDKEEEGESGNVF